MTGGTSPCTKDLYLRASTPWICKTGLVLGTDDMCYPPCLSGYDGDSICSKKCPNSNPTDCSNTLSTSNSMCDSVESSEADRMKSAINSFIDAPNL